MSETTQERHQRIADEAQHLLDGGVWPDTIAQMLDYANAASLSTKLRRWGYRDLSRRFLRVNFDGLVSNGHRTAAARREGASV